MELGPVKFILCNKIKCRIPFYPSLSQSRLFSLIVKSFLKIYNKKDDIHLEPTGTTKWGTTLEFRASHSH